MLGAGLGVAVSQARPTWNRARDEGLVRGDLNTLTAEALDLLGVPAARRAATLPGPITLEDLERIEKHVAKAWGDGLVDLQAKQEAAYLAEVEEVIRRASLERWEADRFRARIGAISEEYGVRGWGSKAQTWYQTVILNSSYSRGGLMAYAGTSAERLFPYLGILTMGDERVRARHRLLHGFVARLKWTGWNRYAPPLDWGCRCKLVPISYDVARAAKYKTDFPRGQRFLKAQRAVDDDGQSRKITPGPSPDFAQPLQVFNDVLPFR